MLEFSQAMTSTHLTGLSQAEVSEFVAGLGEPDYRARQIFADVHARRLRSFDEMTDLPKDLRSRLNQEATIATLTLESRYISTDGTRRYLFKTRDNLPVETVFIPEERRDTICFSSQSGCPLQCTFCLTAQLGLLRNLTAGEIVEQIIFALNDAYGAGVRPPRGTNLVGMGAGEPFLNFEDLMKAVRVMKEPRGLHIVPNRITVSTAGVVPRIRELAMIPDRPHLAVSLAAPNDKLRTALMPINKKWNLKTLIDAAHSFPLRTRERLTFEYVLLDRVNDSLQNACEVVELIRGIRTKVNLIALNPGPGVAFETPSQQRVLEFQQILVRAGISTFIRRPRGRDIYAACGQLKRTSELILAIETAPKDGP